MVTPEYIQQMRNSNKIKEWERFSSLSSPSSMPPEKKIVVAQEWLREPL